MHTDIDQLKRIMVCIVPFRRLKYRGGRFFIRIKIYSNIIGDIDTDICVKISIYVCECCTKYIYICMLSDSYQGNLYW